jgi:DNA-nicking Smr family endonuclease
MMSYHFQMQPCQSSLDLHGFTIQQAHSLARSFIQLAAREGRRGVTIITGKSGEIRREFPVWASLHENVRGVEELNGGGAFYVKLRKH